VAIGFLSLLWFLLRVLPKPSRAFYPCQRAAAPLAGGFLVWLIGLSGAAAVGRSARSLLRRRRPVAALASLAVAGLLLAGATLLFPTESPLRADPPLPNQPIGTARGIFPGRVVWIHDPCATDWLGPGDGHWWEPDHTDRVVVARMFSLAVQSLTGEATDADAWDALFRHYNVTHGNGDTPYAPGERIAVKVNFVGCHYLWGGVDPVTYDMTSGRNYMNTSPQMILALLHGLVDEAGVPDSMIAVGDPLARFPTEYYDPIVAEFPNLVFLDHDGGAPGHPRTAVQYSTIPFYWSCDPAGVATDYIPQSNVEADYFINLASFKSHSSAGVTFCVKNLYGSLIRLPVAAGYYDMHDRLAARAPAPGGYRSLVDLLGHDHFGGKTLLYLMDGLYSGVHPDDSSPRRWDAAPFGGDWTSSIFASLDPVALESVGFDLMQSEGDPRAYPQMAAVDDYLTEAALANAPPSGTFYDPNHDGDVERLSSQGVHEHWNNGTDREYSRNLGTGDGIELVSLFSPSTGLPSGREEVPLALRCAPNPFRSETVVSYALPAPGPVEATVHDVRGRVVRELIRSRSTESRGTLIWDGRTEDGSEAAPGIYFVRIRSMERIGSIRIVRVR